MELGLDQLQFRSYTPPEEVNNSPLQDVSDRVQDSSDCLFCQPLCEAIKITMTTLAVAVLGTLSLACFAMATAVILIALPVLCGIALYNHGFSSEAGDMISNWVKGSCVEVLAFMLATSTFPILGTWFDPTSNHVNEATQPPLLLVHGYGHISSAWLIFRYFLENKYDGPIYTVNLGLPLNSIEQDYSQVVKDKVLQIQGDTGNTELNIIAHSMGGLVASYFATEDDCPADVKNIITLGSPLEGTYMSMFGIGECTNEMFYQSPFVTELTQRIMNDAKGIQFTHIGSETDAIIIPAGSATPAYGKNNITLPWMGHLTYLYSKDVVDISEGILSA